MRYPTVPVLLVVMFVAVACGTGTPADDSTTSTTPIAADGVSLTISGFSFGDPISIPIGTEVTITNDDAVTHTWTSGDGLWDSGSLSGDESFSFTFSEPGEYAFFCRIHSSMMGTITVTG